MSSATAWIVVGSPGDDRALASAGRAASGGQQNDIARVRQVKLLINDRPSSNPIGYTCRFNRLLSISRVQFLLKIDINTTSLACTCEGPDPTPFCPDFHLCVDDVLPHAP